MRFNLGHNGTLAIVTRSQCLHGTGLDATVLRIATSNDLRRSGRFLRYLIGVQNLNLGTLLHEWRL